MGKTKEDLQAELEEDRAMQERLEQQIKDFKGNRDSRAFRKYLEEITPDIELKFDYTSQTGNLHKIDVPLGIDFFWPAAE